VRRSGRAAESAGGQKGTKSGHAREACPVFVWPRNFTVTVRKGLKDTTSTHRARGSIFPRPRRALFQPCSRGPSKEEGCEQLAARTRRARGCRFEQASQHVPRVGQGHCRLRAPCRWPAPTSNVVVTPRIYLPHPATTGPPSSPLCFYREPGCVQQQRV
jgi:hypothetical protein